MRDYVWARDIWWNVVRFWDYKGMVRILLVKDIIPGDRSYYRKILRFGDRGFFA
jgi:hypothetical protein